MRPWTLFALSSLLAVPAYPAPEGAPEGRLEARLLPLSFQGRWESNVRRDPGGGAGDLVSVLSGGAVAEALPRQGDLWSGRVEVALRGEAYGREDGLDNLRNDLDLQGVFRPGPFQFNLSKLYSVRRSRLPDWDYWDDGYRGEARWSGPAGLDAGLGIQHLVRTHFDRRPVWASRDSQRLGWMADLAAEAVPGRVTFLAAVEAARLEHNRYAVGGGSGGLWVKDEVQADPVLAWEGGVRLFLARFLHQFGWKEERVRSNSVGFAHRVQSLTWAWVWEPGGKVTVEGFGRFFRKRYDQDPLRIPEFARGWTEEDGGDRVSLRVHWAFRPRWSAALGATRLRAEGGWMDEYYAKDRVDVRLDRNF
jgi:hypothetical protein